MTNEELTELMRIILAEHPTKTTWTISGDHLLALANKVIEREREACAKLCEEYQWADRAAEAIRARGDVHAINMSQERVDETAKDRHEFEEMVKKGTKAWDGTPDDWVDDLRGGAEKQEPVAHLWECLGRWSAYLASHGDEAELAPPQWLCDAINAATAPPKREWVGLDGDIPGLGLVTEEFYNGMLCAEDILRRRNT